MTMDSYVDAQITLILRIPLGSVDYIFDVFQLIF